MVTTLLWSYVWIVLILHLATIYTQELARVAVDVVLYRTTSVVADSVELLRHLQLHAVAEHWHYLSLLVGSQLLANYYLALSCQCVGHCQSSLHVRHVECRYHCVSIHIHALQLHLWVLPHTQTVLQSCAVVVVGWCAPELWYYRLTVLKHLLAVYVKIVYPSAPLADGKCGASCIQLHVALGLLLLHACLLCSQFGILI